MQIIPPKRIGDDEGGNYVYDIVVSSGVWRNSGTTANVALTITGEMHESKTILLRNKNDECNFFSRGGIDGFEFLTSGYLGQLKEITITHDNTGENPSWFVENVIIKDNQTDEQWCFPVNRWLAVEKGDGQIDVTVRCLGKANPIGFSDQVRTRAPRRLADSHIWMSVAGKASSSTFTRVQRASCCLSILFSAMIANAMFYNIGGESEGAIRVGPFKFSWRQIVVGVQSGLIVAPVNIFIVLLFRSSRPRKKVEDNYKVTTSSLHLVETMRESSCALPHFCIYIGWLLCIVTSLTGATFTVFYSLMWGKELAEQWLASVFTSLSEDVFVMQPTKVMVVIVLTSLFFNKEKGSGKESEVETESFDHEYIEDDPNKLLRSYELAKMRENKKKEVKLIGMMKEIVLHLLFIFLMAIACYGNKNNNRFLMTSSVRDPFLKFKTVSTFFLNFVLVNCIIIIHQRGEWSIDETVLHAALNNSDGTNYRRMSKA